MGFNCVKRNKFHALQLSIKSRTDQVQHQIDSVNKAGNGLIGTAAAVVNTQGLEDSLEAVNDKWSHINQKILERERKLDAALLQSGKFKDALVSLIDWLGETEEMVSTQKPPSSDYKVVKAQLQEQKVCH